jgi:hypothetical protein
MLAGLQNNASAINAVTGAHFSNPTYDSYMAQKIHGILPEDREVGLSLPMFSKVYQTSPSSMRFCGAVRPFDFISTSAESFDKYWSEKGAKSLADGAFWQGLIMVQDYVFNWSGIEGVHKIKQFNYISQDVSGYYCGQHKLELGIDWYFTNTFNNAYFYRPDYTPGTEPSGLISASSLYDLNQYIYRPNATGTSLFGNIEDRDYSGLFASGGVFNVTYVCNSSIINSISDPIITADVGQGLWHSMFLYDFQGVDGSIVVDHGKLMTALQHPYFSALYPMDTLPVFPSGALGGWNQNPSYPMTPNWFGPLPGQGKQYVCPIMELKSPNLFNTSDKVCVGVYTKLTPRPDLTQHRANSIMVGNRKEQIIKVWKKGIDYRPMTPETVPSPYAGPGYPDFGPYTIEDINGGGYMMIYSKSNKDMNKGWHMLEYWMIIAETKEQVISKINLLHSMGVAEAEPGLSDLPKAIQDSVLANPVVGTL